MGLVFRNSRWLFLALGVLGVFLSFLPGCGSNGGGIEDWQKTPTTAAIGDISGKVLAPVPGLSNRSYGVVAAVGGAVDAVVYLEERPEFDTRTDAQGNFLMRGVPLGKYHLIAEYVLNMISYRRRSDLFNVTLANATNALSQPLQLIEAKRQLVLQLIDRQTLFPVVNATVSLWGRNLMTASSGEVILGPVLTGVWPVKVQAIGYYEANLLLNFDEKRQNLMSYRLTPLTVVDRNQAPTIELARDFNSLKTFESGNLSATALDPEGDVVTYAWETSGGSLSSSNSSSNVFTAPDYPGKFKVHVLGNDGRGGVGEAFIDIEVAGNGSLPPPPGNLPPLAASQPYPVDGAIGMGLNFVLTWQGQDPNGDPLKYDLYLWPMGSVSQLIATGLPDSRFLLTGLRPFTKYLWQVVSRDPFDAISAENPIWQFTTGDGNNRPPFLPGNPTPPDLAMNQFPSLLVTWTGGDPDGDDGVVYSVMIGTDPNQLQLATETRFTRATLENLELGKTYTWWVLARDQRGGATRGPVWKFTTFPPPNQAPGDPVATQPASGATNVALDVELRWISNDPDGDPLACNVFLGTGTTLEKISEDNSSFQAIPASPLKPGTRYFWQVVVRDDRGGVNPNSPLWSFTTTIPGNLLPNIPMALTPASGATKVATQPVFAWSGGDPDNEPVSYFLFMDQTFPPTTNVAGPLHDTLSWSPLYALAQGQSFYWQIVASDSRAGVSISPIFQFTTRTVLDVDLQFPRLLSITPSDKATEVSLSPSIVLTFSEAMNQVSVASPGLTLSPVLPGVTNFTWDSPSTLRITSSLPLASGAYQTLTIATGALRDLAGRPLSTADPGGNFAVKGKRFSFVGKSDFAQPSGFHSTGFSIAGGPGQDISITVPGLYFGQSIYGILVGDVATAVGNISANMVRTAPNSAIPPWAASCPEAAFREFDRNLAVQTDAGIVPSIVAAATALEGVGTIRDFFIPANGGVATTTAFPNNRITAICVAATAKTLVYADVALGSPNYNLIGEIRKRFEEGIQLKVQDYFGNEPATGPNGDSHLTILLTDRMVNNLIGLFNGADLYPANLFDQQRRESNERKMLYIKYSISNATTLYGTVAHEYTHMVNFQQKRLANNPPIFELTWLSEGLSKYSEELCGYGMMEGDTNTAQIVSLLLSNFRTMSLTEFNRVENYGLSYLFVRFLAEERRFVTTSREAMRRVSASALVGKDNVEALTGEPFSRTLGRFYLSLLLNRYNSPAAPDFGLANLNLRGSYAGIGLPGVPFDMAPGAGLLPTLVPPDGCRYYRKDSPGTSDLIMKFTGMNNPVRAWFIDPRP